MAEIKVDRHAIIPAGAKPSLRVEPCPGGAIVLVEAEGVRLSVALPAAEAINVGVSVILSAGEGARQPPPRAPLVGVNGGRA